MAILSLPERPLLADEVDDGGVTRGSVVVDDDCEGVDDKPAEEDKVPGPARHSYLIPFATLLLVVWTSTHCSA
jgi:hypothetical protein